MTETIVEATPPRRFVSLRRQMITRFLLVITGLTIFPGADLRFPDRAAHCLSDAGPYCGVDACCRSG
jgi:hypothetical protein